MLRQPTGVAGFDDPKFWAALLCYGVSLPLFFEGGLSWDSFQVVMPFLVSFIVVTTLAWDFRIIGNPNHLPCLILHAAFTVSLVFLLNRLMTAVDISPMTDGVSGLGTAVVDMTRRMPFLRDFFGVFDFVLKWLGFAIVLFFVSGAIIFPPRVAVILLLLFGLAFLALTVGRNLGIELWSLFAGLVLSATAFRLQMEDERRNSFWNRIATVLARSGPQTEMDARIKLAMLRRMFDEPALGEKEIRGLAASNMGCASDDPRLNPICARIADQLATQDGLAESRDGRHGWRFVLVLPDDPPDFFTLCARVVRVVAVMGFCIVYILSPIDLIPDATPVFGVVDDMLLGAAGLLSTIRTIYGDGKRSDRPRNRPPFGR